MRRTAIALSILALGATACRSKNAEPEGETSAQAPAASAKPAPAPAAKPKKAARPEPKSLPAPADVATPPAKSEKSESGLAWTILEPGTAGDKPQPQDKVQVHYTGWTKDGKMFDSSEVRGAPATFGVTQVIKGWTEGLQLMTEGEKRRFWIPGKLAYGDKVVPGRPSGQLTFDVKLLKIIKAPEPPEVPKDVAAAPANAKKTASGLAYVELKAGTGKTPTTKDRVQVHYSGWSKDGKMFDSSVMRGQPSSFGVTQVIKGWTEGLQLMKEGAKYRFWIPADLAYGDKPRRPGAPSGQLTFDVELIKVL